MKRVAFAVAFCCSSSFAGVPGTYVETYTLTNNAGQTANDLHVNVADLIGFSLGGPSPIEVSSTTFPSNVTGITSVPNGEIDFSGANVLAANSATFTVTQPSTLSNLLPVVLDYQWSSNGTLIGSEQFPIGVSFVSGAPFDPFAEGVIGDFDTVDHSYSGLFVNQNNIPLLTVPSSGTLPGSTPAASITSMFNVQAGPVNFGITDTTAGFQLTGTFTPAAVPEPATWGVSGLILLAMGVAIRRRRVVAR